VTTAIIVQARIGSTRLPGKVLRRLAGKTVLRHVLERCSAVLGIDVVCCATTSKPEDDPVVDEALDAGVEIFRGSEQDVLDRYYRAAMACDAEIIMRVTSDCPLIDPAVCAAVIALLHREDADYACNNMPPSFPHGLDCEAFTRVWLDRAAREAHLPSEREHVTPFLRNHPQARKANLTCPEPGVAGHRWTLDTPADLTFLEALFARLPDGPTAWRVPLALVAADPALAGINTGDGTKAGYA
jgi:spore coat polysaccharide biosynthesis protein SpsF (cytidylyltransferase family)